MTDPLESALGLAILALCIVSLVAFGKRPPRGTDHLPAPKWVDKERGEVAVEYVIVALFASALIFGGALLIGVDLAGFFSTVAAGF